MAHERDSAGSRKEKEVQAVGERERASARMGSALEVLERLGERTAARKHELTSGGGVDHKLCR